MRWNWKIPSKVVHVLVSGLQTNCFAGFGNELILGKNTCFQPNAYIGLWTSSWHTNANLIRVWRGLGLQETQPDTLKNQGLICQFHMLVPGSCLRMKCTRTRPIASHTSLLARSGILCFWPSPMRKPDFEGLKGTHKIQNMHHRLGGRPWSRWRLPCQCKRFFFSNARH